MYGGNPETQLRILSFLITLGLQWALLLAVAQCATIPGTFAQLDFDCGGYVSGFVAHPGGRIVLFGKRPRDEWSKIYYSADNGRSWDEITRPNYRFPTTNGLACDPHHPDQVWISTSGRSAALFKMASGTRSLYYIARPQPRLR
jgi:hypothetical protein